MLENLTTVGPGTLIEGRYELLEQLGEGGFGTVYKARQRTTEQVVALKLIRLSEHLRADRVERRVARFLREIRLCAELHHPNIVRLIDGGQTGDGRLYAVFAYAPGETLADLLAREGALTPREARHLLLQVLDALVCAHSAGVVHRDLKPRNIMITATGARRNAVLLDFGIGALMAESAAGSERLTSTEETLGTPGYAAPEQLRGLEATPSADLFSWGLVMLECLGHRAFTGNTLAELMHEQLGDKPVPIPAAVAAGPFGALLRRVTHKEPTERRLDARAAFAELLASEPIHDGLAAAPADPELRDPPIGASQARERRHVTALCCRLAPSEPRSQRSGEDPDDLLRAHLRRCLDTAQHHRGHLAAALGDLAVFYFGFPVAQQDAPHRAARSALAMLGSGADGFSPVEIRIGIHTGPITVQPGAELAVGDTSRIAAEAASRAAPGSALVTPEAFRLLRTAFSLQAREQDALLELRGATDPRAATPTPEVRAVPLIGRDHELALLRERWTRSRGGAGQWTLVTGEAGIGKSRLVAELRARLAGERHVYLECRCAADAQGNALYPIVDMLGRLLPSRDAAGLVALLTRYRMAPAEVVPLLGPLLAIPPDAAYAPLDVSPQRRRELTFAALLTLLFEMADDSPLLLLVEDLHWADPTTLDLLTQLAFEAPSAPVCVVLTARPEFDAPFSTSGVLQIHLGRLDPPQVRALLGELVDGKPLPEDLIAQVIERTDGVPLFVEEFTRMLLDAGAIELRGARWEWIRRVAETEVPATLRDLLTARLDHLGAARETIQVAAVLGREFSGERLRTALPDGGAGLQTDLDRLVELGFLRRKRRAGEQTYSFRHALVRDAAYESLPTAKRRRLHGHIAAALEAGDAVLAEVRPDVLARHFTAAQQAERAIPYWQKAGERSLAQSANREAIEQLEQALALLATLPDTPARAGLELGLRLTLSVALTATQGYAAPVVGSTYERALALCDQLGDSEQLFPVIWGLGAFHAVRAQLGTALALSRRAQAIADRSREPALLVPAHLLLGGSHLWRGELQTAREQFERGFALYSPATHGPLAALYSYDPGTANLVYLALTLCYLGYPEAAVAKASAAVAQTGASRHAHSHAHSLTRATQVAVLLGESAAALRDVEQLLAISEDKGFPMWRAAGVFLRGRALCQQGEATRGIDDVRAGLQSIAETGTQVIRPEFLGGLAEAYGQLGRPELGLEHVAEALGLVEATDARLHEADLLRIRGELIFQADPSQAGAALAEDSLRQAIVVARRDRSMLWEVRAVTSLARLWRIRGDVPSRDLLAGALAAFTEGLHTPHLRTARAELELRDGAPQSSA